jgi:hypothetical protein
MKKDLHDLLYAVWIDGRTAMIMRDEPGKLHHFEILHNENAGRERIKGETTDKIGLFGTTLSNESHHQNKENNELRNWAKAVADKIRYAHAVYIMGSGETRHLLQNEIEHHKGLTNIIITNTSCKKLSRGAFEKETQKLFAEENY